jgi:hypothetical protein
MAEILESKTTEFCFIPILKNASTWGRHIFLDHLEFKQKQEIFVPDSNKKYIVFLRDPVDRWMTGVMEYIQILKSESLTETYLTDQCQLDPLHLSLLCTIIRFDAHTVRQTDYLRECFPKLPQQNVIYFDVGNENFAKNVVSFLYQRFGVQLPTDKINTRIDNPFKSHIKKQIVNFLKKNPKYQQKIDFYFEMDREFMKHVNFYTE